MIRPSLPTLFFLSMAAGLALFFAIPLILAVVSGQPYDEALGQFVRGVVEIYAEAFN
jgi:hypothetical protein